MLRIFVIVLSQLLLFSLPAHSYNLDARLLKPDPSFSSTNRVIVSQLRRQHFEIVDLNNQFSEQLFWALLKKLDSQKKYFVQTDVEELKIHFHDLDDAIKIGDLEQMTQIFNRYLERRLERYQYALDILQPNQFLDFTLDEWWSELEPDQWQNSKNDLNNLWRKRVKNQILVKMLEGETEFEARENLRERYQEKQDDVANISFTKAFETYINVLASIYDPHTQYMTPDAEEDFNINMSLSLSGIGAELDKIKNAIVITKIFPNGPASKDGRLGTNDELLAVASAGNDVFVNIKGWKIEEVVKLIRGPENSIVKLKIAKNGDPARLEEIAITRQKYVLEEDSASYEIIETNRNQQSIRVAVIKIPSFYIDFEAWQAGKKDFKSASADVKRILKELKTQNVNGLIVDLRDNGGGSLREANVIAGMFIENGPIVQVKLANGYVEMFHDLDDSIHFRGPMAVLVNRMSASASEIVAAALQDHQRAIIVGDTTFGKGTVQTLTPLEFGQLKLTQAKFYRINGDSTQHKGVIPDIEFPSLYNVDNTGESSLDNALEWDNINPLFYRPGHIDQGLVSELTSKHKKRSSSMAGFQFARSYMDLQQDISRSKTFTLNKFDRKKSYLVEQKLKLGILNEYRDHLGLEPIDTLKFNKDEIVENLEEALLQATGEILADWIGYENSGYLGGLYQ